VLQCVAVCCSVLQSVLVRVCVLASFCNAFPALCVAVRCSSLQSVAVCCRVFLVCVCARLLLQRVFSVVCCSSLPCVAVCCSVLQCVAECFSVCVCSPPFATRLQRGVLQCVAVRGRVLQCVAECFSVLQYVVVFYTL